jgi:hypothetical protein
MLSTVVARSSSRQYKSGLSAEKQVDNTLTIRHVRLKTAAADRVSHRRHAHPPPRVLAT